MSAQYSFDIDSIIAIKLVKKRLNPYVIYEKSKPITLLFGLLNSGEYTEAGFRDFTPFPGDIISPKKIIDNGFIIENNKVYHKPYAKIQLLSGYTFEKEFQNEVEAEEWINNLKKKTNKNFETI